MDIFTPVIFNPELSRRPSELLSASIIEVSAYQDDLSGYASP